MKKTVNQKIKEKKLLLIVAKKILASLLLIIMILLDFSAIIYANDNNLSKDEITEKVSFDVNWATNSEKIENVNSNTTIKVNYKIELSGVQSGFRDLKVIAVDKSDNSTPDMTIDVKTPNINNNLINLAKTSDSCLTFKETLEAGIATDGNIYLEFDRAADFNIYDKNVAFILTGTYVNPDTNEIEQIYIEKNLTARVHSLECVDAFDSNIDMTIDSINTNKKTTGLALGEYDTTEINLKTQVDLTAHNVGYGEYRIKLSRTTPSTITDSNSNSKCKVYFTNLPAYLKSDIQRSSDGKTIDIVVKYGEEKDSYTEEELRDIASVFFVTVRYTISSDEYSVESLTTIKSEYIGKTIGRTITKNKNGVSYAEGKDEFRDVKESDVGISYRYGDYLAWTKINADNIVKKDWEKLTNSEKIKLDFITETLYWDRRPEENKENLKVYNSNSGETNASINYTSDEGESKTLKLTNEMTVNKIEITKFPSEVEKIKYYKVGETEPFFVATKDNTAYTVPDGENITEYYTILDKMYGINTNSYPTWRTSWNLDVTKLKNKLSDTEIKKIRSITRYQTGMFGNSDVTEKESATISIKVPSTPIKYSYFQLELGENFDTTVNNLYEEQRRSINLSMYRDPDEIKTSATLCNQDPRFYIDLPDCFEYSDFTAEVIGDTNLKVASQTSNTAAITFDKNSGLFMVDCVGNWDKESVYIKLSFTRKLKETNVNTKETINAYMLTDNGNYLKTESNNLQLIKGNLVPAQCTSSSAEFTIAQNSVVEVKSGVKVATRRVFPKTSTVEGYNYSGTFENPIKIRSGSSVTFLTEISSNGKTINNINIVSRLPFTGNKSVLEKYDLNSNISLLNLKNIKVLKESSRKQTLISSEKYTVYYTNQEDADINSAYTEYIEGDTNNQNAKTIKIKFNEDYELSGKEKIYIQYDMNMPDVENGVVGQLTAISFNNKGETTPSVLEPSPIYVQNGNSNGTIKLQKLFEGYDEGVIPKSVPIQRIKFKLVNIENSENLILNGQTDAEGYIYPNEKGEITLTDVPEGTYEVVEVTRCSGFSTFGYTTVTIENGNTVEKKLQNPVQYVKLTITKKWLDGEKELSQQGSVTVKLTKKIVDSNDKFEFTTYATTNETTGKAEVYVPYASYTVEEVSNVKGWTLSSTDDFTNFTIRSYPTASTTIKNELGKGNLEITKKVPEGSTDTVEGLSFKVQKISFDEIYINDYGKKENLEYEKVITVGDDNAEYTISEDKKQVKIVLKDLYFGDYLITEVNMPSINITDEEVIDRYKTIVKTVTIDKKASEENVKLNIDNVWRTGKIRINKTAEQGVELDQFKFRVYGTSTYGTNVDKIIEIDENGIGTAEVLIGNYTIEEVGTNAFNAQYEILSGEHAGEKTSQLQQYTVLSDKTTNINVNNETVMGYVKIVKTLEDISDASKSSGIQFQINGIAPSGANVNEVITIGEDGTGISGPIPAGGTYELTEIANSLSPYYEPIEPMSVEITKDNTQNSPLVLNIENMKGRGNLEISTVTDPEGGPLYPIVYKIQQINLDEQTGIYSKIDGTEKTIEGNAVGKAKLTNLAAGVYIVEQESIPTDWMKDIPQIVEIANDDTSYVEFTIEQQKESQNTTVTISKQILNPNNTVATNEDFIKYQLNANESFEIKIINTNTKQEYYTFVDTQNNGIIKGLPEGTYEISEVYKPKYNTVSYNEIKNGIESQIKINNEKYLFTIGSKQKGENNVNIKIVNKINKDFGFGGQTSKDNYSKYTQDKISDITNNKAILQIVDEEGNYLPGCTFEIYDSSKNKKITFTPKDKRVIIKGIEPGTYTIKNTKVPDGYLTVEDTQFTVYKDAVRIKRIEVQKNIPRADLVLETVYYTDNNIRRNVAKSKYKIANQQTGELLTFEKQANGNYKRSNLATATDTISIRSGEMTITGIEVGNYEVGLVDITKGYALNSSESVPTVQLTENRSEDLDVVVRNKPKVKDIKVVGDEAAFILDDDGILWQVGRIGDYDNEQYTKIAEGVDKIDACQYGCVIGAYLDKKGDVYIYGKNDYYPENKFTKVNMGKNKFIDISVGVYSMLLLDESGKIWYIGYKNNSGINENNQYINEFVCLNDYEGNSLNNVKITKIFAGKTYSNSENYVIDDMGRVWNFGENMVCVSETENNIFSKLYLNNIKIIDISEKYILAENGKLYNMSTNTCLSDDSNNEIYGKKIVCIGITYDGVIAIDENGKLYVKGKHVGYAQSTDSFICLNDVPNSHIKDVKFEKVGVDGITSGGYSPIILSDMNGQLYGCLDGYSYVGRRMIGKITNNVQNFLAQPDSITINEFEATIPNYAEKYTYNIKFDKVVTSGYCSAAIDKEGRLWTWGNNSSNQTSNSSLGKVVIPTLVEFNEDIKIEDIVFSSNDTTVALDSKGRLWSWGRNGDYPTLGVGINDCDSYSKVCLSTLSGNPLAEAYNKGVRIESLYYVESIYSIMAVDNFGKLWYWGSDYIEKVIGNFEINRLVPTCISELEDCVLKELYDKGIKIKKILYNINENSLKILDTEGNMWTIKNGELKSITQEETILATEILNNGVKIVDVEIPPRYDLIILDNLGRVWIGDKCISLDENNCLYERYNKGEKIISISTYDANKFIALTNKQNVIEVNITNNNIMEMLNNKNCVYIYTRDSASFAIDENGILYRWGNNEYGQLGTGNTANVAVASAMTEPNINEAYGKKFTGVKDGLLEADDGYRYDIISNGILEKKEQYSKYLENNGVTIAEELDNFVLDSEGKVWEKIKGTYICKTDVKGSKLYNAYYNDGIKISHIKNDSLGEIYLIDSKQKLWTKLNTYAGVTDEEFTKVSFDEDIDVEEIIDKDYDKQAYSSGLTIVKDTNGDYWFAGDNTYGVLSNGKTQNSYKFEKIVLNDNVKIAEILYATAYNVYVKDTQGVVWAWGYNYDYRTGESSSKIVTKPYCWNIKIASLDVYLPLCYQNKDIGTVVALDVNGTVWTAGYGSLGMNGRGKGKVGLGKVSNNESMGIITSVIVSSDSVYAINKEGELWVWGCNMSGNLGYTTNLLKYTWADTYPDRYFESVYVPVKLTNVAGNPLCNKKIKSVYDISSKNLIKYTSEYEYKDYSSIGTVLVQDTENNIYILGSDMYPSDGHSGFRGSDAEKQALKNIVPKVIEYNAELKEVYAYRFSNQYDTVILKDVNGNVSSYVCTKADYNISSDTKMDLSEIADEIGINETDLNHFKFENKIIKNNKEYELNCDVKNKKYTIKATRTLDNIITYIDEVWENIGKIDKNGNLYLREFNGKDYGTDMICINNIEVIQEAVFSNRWNIIYKKF